MTHARYVSFTIGRDADPPKFYNICTMESEVGFPLSLMPQSIWRILVRDFDKAKDTSDLCPDCMECIREHYAPEQLDLSTSGVGFPD